MPIIASVAAALAFAPVAHAAPANDAFSKATVLPAGLPSSQAGSNLGATKEAGEPNHAGNAGGHSVWYSWTPSSSRPVGIHDACFGSIEALIAVYTGAAVNALTPVASNESTFPSDCFFSESPEAEFEATAGTTYWIAVDGKDGAQGSFDLQFDPLPANDGFADAESIGAKTPQTVFGSTRLSGKEAGEPDHAGDPGGHSVWYSWVPAKSAEVELDACTGTFDPLFAAYTGAAVDDLSPVSTTDVGPGECDEGGSIRFAAVAGTTYRLAVDGREGDEGHFELHFRPVTSLVHLLTVSKAGGGIGSVVSSPSGLSCGSTCGHQFEDGTAITLTASPAAGSSFGGWSGGACSGTGPCQLVLNADTTVTATFDALPAGGGEGRGSGGGSTGATPAPPSPPPVPKPRRCKQGFKRKIVGGKPRCVKKKNHKHRPGRRAG